MPNPSLPLDAAIRAIQGESDVETVRPAFDDWRRAQIIALAATTHPVIHAVAALCGDLLTLLDAPTVADPALHDVVVRLIGTNEGWHALWTWALVAPAGWGRHHAAALVNAVNTDTCVAGVAAALIGPCNESAALLCNAQDIAFAVRRWGQSFPETPTAWADALSTEERKRLIDEMLRSPSIGASCLPWLPLEDALQMPVIESALREMLEAFTKASPTARACHAALLQRLIAQTSSAHLGTLTRLACVMESREVWDRVQTLVQKEPDDASYVVVAEPWDALDAAVRDVILEHAGQSNICAAIAAARGCKVISPSMHEHADVFFAALDPGVWDALDRDAQRQWPGALQRDALLGDTAYLAIRTLGLRPEFLAHVKINEHLEHAAQRHVRDAATLRDALLPVALRAVDIAEAFALTIALPLPSNPGVFFAIASGHTDPSIIIPASTTLRRTSDLARAVLLQRCADRIAPIRHRCAALHDALRGWSWNDMEPILPLLDADARAALVPDIDELVNRLARPVRRKKMRQALAFLATLSPEIAIPTFVALNRLEAWDAPDAAEALADALRAYGDVFLEITDALADANLRVALLPLPKQTRMSNALRDLACDDPLFAHHLAHALHDRSRRAALHALLKNPPRSNAVWLAMDENLRRVIGDRIAAASRDAAAFIIRDFVAGLALTAVHSDDANVRHAGVAVLSERPALARTIWDSLPQEVHQSLHAYPEFVDLGMMSDRPSVRRRHRH